MRRLYTTPAQISLRLAQREYEQTLLAEVRNEYKSTEMKVSYRVCTRVAAADVLDRRSIAGEKTDVHEAETQPRLRCASCWHLSAVAELSDVKLSS